MSHIQALVSHFGSKNKLAKALGITLPAVSRWKETIPECRAYQIEVITQGKFKANDLTKKEVSHG